MNKFNKSKMALLMALASVCTVNNKSNASMVGNICDIATASSISASLAINNNNKSAAIAAVSLGFIGAIGIPVVAYFWNQKVERDKLADSIINSLRYKNELSNVKDSLKKSKDELDELFKQSKTAFNKKETTILELNLDYSEEEGKNKFKQILDNCNKLLESNSKVAAEKNAQDFINSIVNTFVVISKELSIEEKIGTFIILAKHLENIKSLDALNEDLSFHKQCRASNTPFRFRVCKNQQGELSSVCDMNFIVTDWHSYDNGHDVCFRMSDKFELLIDGHSYDIDEMTKKK